VKRASTTREKRGTKAKAAKASPEAKKPSKLGWGGARAGAGRKTGSGRAPGHFRRAELPPDTPVHLTMFTTEAMHVLRRSPHFEMVRSMIAGAQRDDFRIVCFSVQEDRIHLVCEADDASALGHGLQWFSSMIARGANCTLGRKGQVWRQRYRRRDLTTPKEVRAALVETLLGRARDAAEDAPPALDRCSSALWFDGWRPDAAKALATLAKKVTWESPVAAPKTPLLRAEWRKSGLLSVTDRPAS